MALCEPRCKASYQRESKSEESINIFPPFFNLVTGISFPGVDEVYPPKLKAGNENLSIKCPDPG